MNGTPTGTIPHDAAASAVQTALNAVAGVSGAVVTGSAGGPYSITFTSPKDLGKGTLTLTGGTSPDITVA